MRRNQSLSIIKRSIFQNQDRSMQIQEVLWNRDKLILCIMLILQNMLKLLIELIITDGGVNRLHLFLSHKVLDKTVKFLVVIDKHIWFAVDMNQIRHFIQLWFSVALEKYHSAKEDVANSISKFGITWMFQCIIAKKLEEDHLVAGKYTKLTNMGFSSGLWAF